MTVRMAYIAGFGRSGSTLLDRCLARLPGVVGLGECAFLADAVARSSAVSCSCGAHVRDCDLWGRVIAAVSPVVENLGGWIAVGARRARVEGASFVSEIERDRHGQFQVAFLEALRAARPEASIYVDSSKTARLARNRPRVLHGHVDLRVIHLIRDGRAVLQSTMRGSNRALEKSDVAAPIPTWRTIAGYTMANRAAASLRRTVGHAQYRVLRYEAFTENPDAVLAELAAFLDVPFVSDWRVRPIGVEHRFAGNRNRNDVAIEVRRDDAVSSLSGPSEFLWRIAGCPAREIIRRAGR